MNALASKPSSEFSGMNANLASSKQLMDDFYQLARVSFNDYELKALPEQLFFKGDLSLLTRGRRVSVVGSRDVSVEGEKRTYTIVRHLIDLGITVVSGLAKGVDTVAHTTAINSGGKTIAILGTPLELYFPTENKELQRLISNKFLTISQFGHGYPVTKANFPMRNRTMALLTEYPCQNEATEKSGTRHQAEQAIKLGRPLFLLSNVIKSCKWANDLLDYGAYELTRDNLNLIDELTLERYQDNLFEDFVF